MKWWVGEVTVTKIVELEVTGGNRFILPQVIGTNFAGRTAGRIVRTSQREQSSRLSGRRIVDAPAAGPSLSPWTRGEGWGEGPALAHQPVRNPF